MGKFVKLMGPNTVRYLIELQWKSEGTVGELKSC